MNYYDMIEARKSREFKGELPPICYTGHTMPHPQNTPQFIRVWSVQFPEYTARMKAMNTPQAVHDAIRLAGHLTLMQK